MAKIAIITPFYNGIGGAETFCKALENELADNNHVHVITLHDNTATWQGTPIIKSAVLFFRLFVELIREKAYQMDILYAQGLTAAMACRIFKLIFRTRFSVTILALYDFDERSFWLIKLVRWTLKKSETIYVEGETGRKDILHCGIQNEKIKSFYHWVDLNKFKPIARTWKTLRILFVGRPIWIKGKHIVEDLERKFFLEDISFRYVENLPYNELVKEYQTSDILIVPSIYSEGFPRVVFEAAACGCVILTSNFGALPELVRNFGHFVNGEYENIIRNYMDDDKSLLDKKSETRKYAERFFNRSNAEAFHYE